MDSYAARLATFNATLTSKKKRPSDAKGARALKWPHQAPSPSQLAKAGFFYKPTSSNPDNATCYLCLCNLDGWEEDDDPVAEHLKHSPGCGWALTASIEQAVERGERSLEDPMSKRLLEARAMTFGTTWPHESKRGWVCKSQKMVEAGWHYCPTLESDDFVRCAYCNLSLDGWEPKDSPYDEHQRRSPDCMFFSLSAPSQATKSKKGRPSKASRTSTLSMSSLVPEEQPILETDPQNDSLVSVAESVKTSKSVRGGKKGKKTKSRITLPEQDDSQLASSFIEPEDDDFEVKVVKPAATKAKGKKRNSEGLDELAETSTNVMPKKRRTTRTRTSAASVTAAAPDINPESKRLELDQDVPMTDIDEVSQPSKPGPKKGRKRGKTRGSSTARKASSKSIASEASLRAGLPNDEDIEAALAEDLDRPLTDDGDDEEQEMSKPITGRDLTKTKHGLRAPDASTARTRRTTRASSVTVDDSVADPYSAVPAALEGEQQQADDAEKLLAKPILIAKAGKKTGTRKASGKQKDTQHAIEAAEELPAHTEDGLEAVRTKQIKGRIPSQPLYDRGDYPSNLSASQTGLDTAPTSNTFASDRQGLEDESGHETDANTNGRKKRGKKASVAKSTKGGKKAGPKSRGIEDVSQTAVSDQLVGELEDAEMNAADDVEDPEPAAGESKKVTKKQSKSLKTGPRMKAKKAVLKAADPEEAVHDANVSSEPAKKIEEPSSPPGTSIRSTPRPVPSPQSSDAENQPPSSRPSQSRPPLSFESPFRSQELRVPLAVITTPSASPSKGDSTKLQSSSPWTAMDINQIFHGTPETEKENNSNGNGRKLLTSPEKKLTVEEWIKFNAQRGEERLRNGCERLVGRFEDHGVRALKTLEGIVCTD